MPSFHVDSGFRYLLSPELSDRVTVGSIVRVPLGGRRVRGYVVSVDPESDTTGLKGVAAVSGSAPAFDHALLDSARALAAHYVAPLAVLLDRTSPPNVPKKTRLPSIEDDLPVAEPHPLDDPMARLAGGGRIRPVAYVTRTHDSSWFLASVVPVLAAGGSVMIVAPTAKEVERIGRWSSVLPSARVVIADPAATDRDVTRAWSQAGVPGRVVVGSPRIAMWRVAGLRLCVVLEEGRRAMKDRATPTLHVREVLRVRSQRSGAGLVFVGPTPTTEVLSWGADIRRTPDRLRSWPLVEVVDRNESDEVGRLVSHRTQAAIRAAIGHRRSVLVFTHRRGYAPAARCVSCRTLRRCPTCGSRPDPGPECRRCGAALGPCTACGARRFEPLGAGVERASEVLSRLVGAGVVGGPNDGRPVIVGSERDLVHISEVDLAVVLDADGLILGTNYRAEEEALRVLARVASMVRSDRGNRMIVQTGLPGHRVVSTLRRADPLPFLLEQLDSRAAAGLPPSGQLLIVEVRHHGGVEASSIDEEIRAIDERVTVHGPALTSGGSRWLLQAHDLRRLRQGLRPLVQRLRDGGDAVRVDADPIDL